MKDFFCKPLKIKGRDDQIFFWSDLHMGHRCENWSEPLWLKRGFKTLEEHDRVLIERWNKTIDDTCTVFHLGDIMFGMNGKERLVSLLERLSFHELYLFPGNHTAGFKNLLEEWGYSYLLSGYKQIYFVPNYFEAFINGQAVVLSHYCIASYNGQARGSWMIHGHSHGSLYNTQLGDLIYKGKVIDVGVENCPFPISFKELRKKFKDVESKSWDHHTKETQNPF